MARRRKPLPVLQDLSIHDMAEKGRGVARLEDRVVFVKDALPGDVVHAQVTKKRSSYWEARATEIVEASPHRQETFCNHFGLCGGCKLQALKYEEQAAFKERHVVNTLRRVGKVETEESRPIIQADPTTYYRNKLEFTFSNKRWLSAEELGQEELCTDGVGFHVAGLFHKVVDVDHCYLQAEPSNTIRNEVRKVALENDIPFFDIRGQQGYLRNLIVRTASTGECMLILSVFEDQPEWLKIVFDHLMALKLPITSYMYVINPKGNDTIDDLEVQCYSGKDHLEEKLGDKTFHIGPTSFFQTNTQGAEKLYGAVLEMAGLSGKEIVYDLYAGIGSIGLFIADHASKIVGIEYSAAAVEDAGHNAQLNNIDHAHYFSGDMKDLLSDEFVEQNGTPDVIITDPPRAGMHAGVVEALKNIGAPRIVYVSCNPATQARDLALLTDDYTVKCIQPVDMFPHTDHVENVALLVKK